MSIFSNRKFGERLELRDPGLLQARIVIGIEVVEADHVVPVRQQAPRDVHADESGRPGDENRLLQDTSFRVARSAAVGSRRRRRYSRSARRRSCSIKRKMPRAPLPATAMSRPVTRRRITVGPSPPRDARMSDVASEAAALRRWLFDVALPLWWKDGRGPRPRRLPRGDRSRRHGRSSTAAARAHHRPPSVLLLRGRPARLARSLARGGAARARLFCASIS